MRIIQQPPTVILLHSSASSARQWDRLAEALKPTFDVRAIEFHGHGEQSAWRGDAPMTLADEAELAIAALEEAGGAHIVGHSYGGAVALKLATMRPQLVRSVLAYEPVLFGLARDEILRQAPTHGIGAVASSMRQHLTSGNADLAAQVFIDFWSGTGAWDSLPAAKQVSIAARAHAVAQHFHALLEEPLQLSELARLGIPMMFVSGSNTLEITSRIAAMLRAALPADQHVTIEGMGHMGPITHSAQFNQRVVRFLDAQRLGAHEPFTPWPSRHEPPRGGLRLGTAPLAQ